MGIIIGMCWAIIEDRIIRFTHRIWSWRINRVLWKAHNEDLINSEQLRALLAAFDPTQRHMVYGKYSEWTFKMIKEKE